MKKEKSPEKIFKGQISMNKFQKINDEKFSKDESQNDGTIKHSSFKV